MKKYIFLIAIVVVAFVSCDSIKNDIVGTWEYQETISSGNVEARISGIMVLEKNGTCKGDSKVNFKIIMEDEGELYEIRVDSKLTTTEDWQLNGNELAFSPNSYSVDITRIAYYEPGTGYFLGELTGSDFIQMKNEMKQSIANEIMQATTDRIILSQKNKFVTESISDEGKKFTCTYKRIK